MYLQGKALLEHRLKGESITEGQFWYKMIMLGEASHPNVMPLGAYYYSRDEKLLVYDFMPIGSLTSWLHGNHLFSWVTGPLLGFC
jgi:hypothetical protein